MSAGDKPNIFMKNESAEVVSMQSFVQPEGSMKACIIAKQKFKFIFDADIIETLIFGLLLSNSEEEGDEDYSFEQQKRMLSTFLFTIRKIIFLCLYSSLSPS